MKDRAALGEGGILQFPCTIAMAGEVEPQQGMAVGGEMFGQIVHQPTVGGARAVQREPADGGWGFGLIDGAGEAIGADLEGDIVREHGDFACVMWGKLERVGLGVKGVVKTPNRPDPPR